MEQKLLICHVHDEFIDYIDTISFLFNRSGKKFHVLSGKILRTNGAESYIHWLIWLYFYRKSSKTYRWA